VCSCQSGSCQARPERLLRCAEFCYYRVARHMAQIASQQSNSCQKVYLEALCMKICSKCYPAEMAEQIDAAVNALRLDRELATGSLPSSDLWPVTKTYPYLGSRYILLRPVMKSLTPMCRIRNSYWDRSIWGCPKCCISVFT